MATFFKEVVNFDDMGNGCNLSLSVLDGVGEGLLLSSVIKKGKLVLYLNEGEVVWNFDDGQAKFHFETQSRWYYVCVFDENGLVCEGGNTPHLKSQQQVPKINATDAFEPAVANFNYYEKELGKLGKSAESILESVKESVKEKAGKLKGVETLETSKVVEAVEEGDAVEEIEILKVEKEEIKKQEPKKQEPKKQEPKKQEPPKAKNTRKKKSQADFEKMAVPQVEKLLTKFPKEEFLEEVLENSRWCKVEYSKGVYYAVGVIYGDDLAEYIGYAIRGNQNNPPEIENPQFVPLDVTRESGEGYFLIFQKA